MKDESFHPKHGPKIWFSRSHRRTLARLHRVFKRPEVWFLSTYFIFVVGFPGLNVSLPVPGIGTVPIYLVDGICVAMIGYVFNSVGTGAFFSVPDRRLTIAFALFVLGVFPAFLQGFVLSGFSIYFIYTTGRLVLSVAAPLAVLSIVRDETTLKTAVGGICSGLLVIGLLGILGVVPGIERTIDAFLSGYYPAGSYAQYRLLNSYAFATWYTATTYAAVVSMTALFPLVLWLRSGDSTYMGLTLIALVSFVLAETRHPVLVLGPLLLYIGWQNTTRGQRRRVLGGGLLVLVALQVIGVGRTPLSFVKDFRLFLAPLAEQEGVVIRIRSILDFFEFARAYPLRTLIGFGPDYVSIVDRGVESNLLLAARDAKAINSVLTLVLYYGIVGTMGYFAVAGVALLSGLERLREIRFSALSDISFSQGVVYAGTAGLLLGLLLHPFDQYFVFGGIKMRHVFWGILAVQQAAIRVDVDGGRTNWS